MSKYTFSTGDIVDFLYRDLRPDYNNGVVVQRSNSITKYHDYVVFWPTLNRCETVWGRYLTRSKATQ